MASYHLSVKTVSRATGRSGPGAAAYRTATRIECERDGTVHDYTRRAGVEAAFIVAPDGAGWAQDRARLWNAVEAAEKRKDAKVAREYELALPHELGAAGRRELAEGFAREVVSRFGVAADVAIHAPGREGDQRNWHAHVLTTTRRVEAEGLGAKTRELDVVQTSGPAVEALRELWAIQVNHALERIRSYERVDHRSYARRGEELVASQHLGPAASGMERKAARRGEQDRDRATEAPELGKEVPDLAQGRPREATRAVAAPVEALRPAQAPQAAQNGLERTREAAGRLGAFGGREPYPEPAQAAVGPSAGVSGAGAEPATRIGQRNAEILERNRAVQAARAALDAARRVVEGLERAAAAGRRWVAGLARGVGAQAVAEREERARQAERQRQELARQEQARRAEEERQARERVAERERIAVEMRRQEAERRAGPARQTSQELRDAARAHWDEQARQGRELREAEQQARRQQERDVPRHRGPSLGR